MLIDFENARKNVLDILRGKISTPVAIKVVFAMKAATVDAVEVVRCKDCKHWERIANDMGDCTNGRFHIEGHADPTMQMSDFCS